MDSDARIARVGALVFFVLVFFVGFASAQTPDSTKGTAWLVAQVQGDGSLENESGSIATSFQGREETLLALSQLASVSPSLVASVAASTDVNSEYTARRILAASATSQPQASDIAALLALQHEDGGWGLSVRDQSDPLDTAFAIQALKAAKDSSSAIANGLAYLASVKLGDGGWGVSTQSMPYVTANVLMAAVAANIPASTVTSDATAWLLSTRSSSQDYGDAFDDAIALLAFAEAGQTDAFPALASAIGNMQLQDGSWADDPYVTALSLRALWAMTLPSPNRIGARGSVIDGQTGLAISGVDVSLVGTRSYASNTDVNGGFVIEDISPGSYLLRISKSGFNSVVATILAITGEELDFGTIALVPLNTSGIGTVEGTVTDINTGLPLQGAMVTVNGFTVFTSIRGTFEINNLAAGRTTATAAAAGYQTLTTSGYVPNGGILKFTFQLAAGGQPSGDVVGTITDAKTGKPIVGATINVTGANTATAQSDFGGAYTFNGFTPGVIQIVVTAPGYDSATVAAQFDVNYTTTFSPKLYPTGTSPAGANTAGISGIVVDSTNGDPLPDVAIAATLPDGLKLNAVSDSTGHFAFNGLKQNEVALTFSLTNYIPVQFSTPTPPLVVTDIGEVRLRRVGVLQMLADLVVDSVDSKTLATSDPQTLQFSGNVQVAVGNRGTATAPAGVEVLAFYDADQNGAYDPATDIVLGTAATPVAIDPQATLSVAIPVGGTLPFRDAPVTAWVNSAQDVVELDATNNYGSSTSQCRLAPPPTTIIPTLKWAWNGSSTDKTDVNVFGPVIVGHLTDDNGDGRYDENDIPTLVFPARALSPESVSALVAVSGKDGHEIWRRTDIQATGNGSVAIADIDGDGKPEVLVPNYNRTKLYALRNDGSVLWSANTGPAFSAEAVFDGITVADLNQDGKPEIIHGKRVFDNKGKLLWTGAGDSGGTVYSQNYGFVSIAADVRPDSPGLEVIAGRTLYGADGHIIWNRTNISCDGFNAVGDFGYPDPPQIVLVGCGSVNLLDRNGATIWKAAIVGGGQGGPPTIADFDGEGKPQIGVAASFNYTVYGAEGSIRWTAKTHDTTSNVTGSSAFDFVDNGRIEVLYGDEQMLRIFDGASGSVLWSTENPSGTTFEYPVIADVDNDGHADIIVGANASPSSSSAIRGIRVFSAATGGWAPTRTIWNEHAYHVTNINDDGSVPQFEPPSWEHGNTYRLNAFLGHGPLDGADLTAALLQVTDNGTSQPLTLSARIGNGGQIASGDTIVAFYAGNPANGGSLIGSVPFNTLGPSQYRDVQLSVSSVPLGTSEIYVIVDPDGHISECDKTNNSVHIQFSAGNILAHLSVATDAASYPANGPAQLIATATNRGSFAGSFTVDLRVEDLAGSVVVDFGAYALGTVNPGAIAKEVQSWNTSTTLAGPYVLHGFLRDSQGNLVSDAVTAFSIFDASASATSTVHTDKQTYNPSAQVQILSHVQSLSSNTILGDLSLIVGVYDASGLQQFAHTYSISQLLPGQMLDLSVSEVLNNATSGLYTVKQDLLDGQGTQFNHVEAAYNVSSTSDTGFGLTGTISAAPKTLALGGTLALTATASNHGNSTIENLPLTITIVDPDQGTVLTQFSQTSTLPIGGSVPFDSTWITQGQSGATYFAVLAASVGSGATAKSITLAVDSFQVILNLDVNVAITASKPPLAALVLLDPNPSSTQLAQITSTLATINYVATYVFTATDFADAVRTGAYQLYALLSSQVAPDTTTLRLLREGVHRGEGLLSANGMNTLPHALADVAGLEPSDDLTPISADSMDVLGAAPGNAVHVAFNPALSGHVVIPGRAQTQAILTGRLSSSPDQGALSDEVVAFGRIDIGYFGTESGTDGSHLSLASMGRVRNADGSDCFTIWRIRNSDDAPSSVTLASVSDGYSLTMAVTPHTDTFVASPVVEGTADHRLTVATRTIQTESALTMVFNDARIVDVGNNPGAVALWANAIGTTGVLDWSGGQEQVHGAVHSNSDIRLSGAQNIIDGPVHYVTGFTSTGNQNTFTFPPRPVAAQSMPTLLNLDDFKPGGPVAQAAGTHYFDGTAECSGNRVWVRNSSQMPLSGGVYWVPCDVRINAGGNTSAITLVSTGTIQIDGAKGTYQPYYQGIQFATTSPSVNAIRLSGDSTQIGGVVIAPHGTVQLNGSSLSLQCSVIADQIRFANAKTAIDARECAYATIQRQSPAVVLNAFGGGWAAYAAYNWPLAIARYEASVPGELTSLFGGVLDELAPTQYVLRAGSVIPLGISVQNLHDPFRGQLTLQATDDSTLIPPTAAWSLDFSQQSVFQTQSNVRLGSSSNTELTATVSAISPAMLNPLKQSVVTIAHVPDETIDDVIAAVSSVSSPDAGLSAALADLQAAQAALAANDHSGELTYLLDAAEACGQSVHAEADALRTRIDWVIWASTH